MQKTENVKTWVVYQTTLQGKSSDMSGVRRVICEQDEWDAMEREQPGKHTLVRSGITNEGEAERLARGTSGDARTSSPSKKRS
jgi:hypothetical protein